MAKGQQKLFSVIRSGESTPKRPRRRNYLLPQRNEALAHRYHYYAHIRHVSYIETIKALSAEFYLSEDRIIHILMNDAFSTVEDLADRQVGAREMRAKYPHFVW